MRWAIWRAIAIVFSIFVAPAPVLADDTVRITGLTDVAFGTIASFEADYVREQSICVYSKSSPADNYRVTASGSGSGGAFHLISGSNALPYEVQWSDTAGQLSGFRLAPNVSLTGQHSTAKKDDCKNGPATTATLIVVLRSAAIAGAIEGAYSGSLTLVIAPE